MGSLLGDLPSFNPHNFSQLRPSDPSKPSGGIAQVRTATTSTLQRMTPTLSRPIQSRALPPPDQVITTEAKNILIRKFYQRAEEKLRPKRAASELLTPDHGSKHLRPSSSASS